MIILITAIFPEAKAILSGFSMKKVTQGTFTLYEDEHTPLRLLVTGSGKLNAAMAVTEYLTTFSVSLQDIFCNIGICGGESGTSVGDGFLCASVTELTTGKSVYPELYHHPFPEARLFTSDVPVTSSSVFAEKEGGLPSLYDMEAYGVATALFRKVMPSHCFFYKIVSDICNGTFPTPETVTKLIQDRLPSLLTYLYNEEEKSSRRIGKQSDLQNQIDSMVKKITGNYSFSATMERKLTGLLTYGLHTGITETELFRVLPKPTDSPHKKKEALHLLKFVETYILQKKAADFSYETSCSPKEPLHPFQHIYVEREVLTHPVTEAILSRLPNASVLPVEHYKDIFNRGKQDLSMQETEPSLILAKNSGTLFYPGAPVCQSFGEEHFMYTSCVMNCLYDCDYCYLQGMYPGRNVVVFVNLEDYFTELDRLLAKHPVYLCCSYDSDLTALNGLLPHAKAFCDYAAAHSDLRLELRTKSAALPFIKTLPAAQNIVMAFTLSPDEIIRRYEHHTPSLQARLRTAKEVAARGFSLRLCFDPILDVPNASELYSTLVDVVFSVLSPEEITDISLGVFRLSKEYLKQLKKAKPYCSISHYPYELTDGVCHYRPARCEELISVVRSALCRYGITEEKLFLWTPEEPAEEPHVMEGEPYVKE